jgi:hypothetical protein
MKCLKSSRGEILVGVAVLIYISMFIIAFAFHTLPVFTVKHQLDSYAEELCRTAAVSGEVGSKTNARLEKLNELYNLSPTITWSKTGKIQLNEEISVECTVTKELGLFGGIGSFPVRLVGKATGRSEVYWK